MSYLSDDCQACLLLLTVDHDLFFVLSEAKQRIVEVNKIFYNLSRIVRSCTTSICLLVFVKKAINSGCSSAVLSSLALTKVELRTIFKRNDFRGVKLMVHEVNYPEASVMQSSDMRGPNWYILMQLEQIL